tara:strand:+ start:291 stop:974 length:684 start_codon:yes stop_codon:yes gene_type:complete
MENIWLTIISGGFSGAAVVVFLGKLLVNNAFKKSLTHYQHELDIRKQSLQTELIINAEQLKLKFSQYEVSKKDALERIYASVAKTSIPRAKLNRNYNFKTAENFQAEYFGAFQEAFDAFDLSFQKISFAYECLEDNAIYISGPTELLVTDCLSKVLASYQKSHNKLRHYHAETQILFKNGKLSLKSSPLDFSVFSADIQSNWNELAAEPKKILKDTIRDLLTPEGCL